MAWPSSTHFTKTIILRKSLLRVGLRGGPATEQNGRQKGGEWRFTTADARIKLKRLCPQIQL